MKRSILALLAGVVLMTSARADIALKFPASSDDFASVKIAIFNVIEKRDYAKLVRYVDQAETHREKRYEEMKIRQKSGLITIKYFLDSTGGDVETALKIGRFLRKKNASVIVPKSAVCLSSCVLVSAGATHRSLFGKIGIHRPYQPNDTTTSAARQKIKYNKIGSSVKTYLSEMNVKPQLYDDMLYISPENIRILSYREQESYGLVMKDPFQEEADAVKMAKFYGISRQEYGKRVARGKAECGIFPLFDSKNTARETEIVMEKMSKHFKCTRDIKAGHR